MQQYAYTKGCRRGFVLRYFGDPAARTTCGGCDNCLGTRVDVERGGAPARADSAVAEAKRRARLRRADAAAPPTMRRSLSGADEALLAACAICAARSPRGAGAGVRSVSRSHAGRDRRAPADERPTRSGEIRGVGPVKLEKYGETISRRRFAPPTKPKPPNA